MIKYDKYKDSGVDWLGEIPGGWKIVKAKDISRKIGDGLHGTPEYTDNQQYHFINGNNLNNGRIDLTGSRTISFDEYKKLEIRFSDQTLLLSINGTIGNISFFNNEFVALGKSVAYIELKPNFNKCFFYYLLLTNSILDFFELELTGTTIKNLSLKTIRNTHFILPPFSEQTAIATYLDSKTSAIDRKVALLEQKITHYQQLRKSLINETVCRGLNKNVKLKDSGIDWIGRIPEHWEVKRLKDVCGFINRGSSPNYVETGSYKVVNQATFSKGFWDESSLRFTQNFEVKPRGLLKEDDILIASTGGGVLGKVYFFNRKESDYIADSHITILRDTRKSYFSKYVYYYFSEKFKLINDILAQGSTNQTELQKDWLLAFFICIPPQPEQVAIANFLDEKTQKIDSIISNIKTQIETLKELRKTLINDVVTGKIKVINH